MTDRSLVFMIPGDLETLTGGYGYDRRIVGGLRQLGWQVEVIALDRSFPTPTRFAREDAGRRFAAIADDSLVLVDGLAFGVLADEAEVERHRLRLVALVHHPLADETGLDSSTADLFDVSERRALSATRLVIVTSKQTADRLSRFDVEPGHVVVVEPGTDSASLSRGSTDGIAHLLCVASLIPRKGHEILIEALARLRDKPWRLTCVGSTERDPGTAARVRALIAQYDLMERVRFTGDLHQPDLDREYDAADVFVLPTFHEGYGMVVSEALARGLPVISCPTGAIAEMVTDEAGILVPAGHIAELVAALRELIEQPDVRARLAGGARRVRDRLPTWEQSARRMADALNRAAGS